MKLILYRRARRTHRHRLHGQGRSDREGTYLGILVERDEGKPVFMATAAGGMDIEQVAAERPKRS